MNKKELRNQILTLKRDSEHWQREYHRVADRAEALNKAVIQLVEMGIVPDKYLAENYRGDTVANVALIKRDRDVHEYLKDLSPEQREELLSGD